MTTFDLRALIAQHLDATDAPADPDTVWAAVVAEIPAKHLRAALLISGGHMVDQIVSRRRNAALARAGSPSSDRWSAASDAYQGLLAERLFTSDGWKFLGDCTTDDLLSAAGVRRQQAMDLNARAEFYEGLASLMSERGAATVAELPAGSLEQAA